MKTHVEAQYHNRTSVDEPEDKAVLLVSVFAERSTITQNPVKLVSIVTENIASLTLSFHLMYITIV